MWQPSIINPSVYHLLLITRVRSGVHCHSACHVLGIAEPYNNSETLLLPAASDRCSAVKVLAGVFIDIKLTLEPCLKSSLYLSNQYCEIQQT